MINSFDRTIIVSNRLPVKFVKENNKLRIEKSCGGLTSALGSIYPDEDSLWVGWPGIVKVSDIEKNSIGKILKRKSYYPVFLSEEDYNHYYTGYCNQVIWPAYHGFLKYCNYNPLYFRYYKEVNLKFFKALDNLIKKNDLIWINDFHLMLLPGYLKKKFKYNPAGFFFHTPFPEAELFKSIPNYQQLLEGILEADLIGFYIENDKSNFLELIHDLNLTDNNSGNIANKIINVKNYFLGIDTLKYELTAQSYPVFQKKNIMKYRINAKKIILSVQRLDYTKGITELLDAYSNLLKNNQNLISRVILLLVVVPSREEISYYKTLKDTIFKQVKDINGDFQTGNWKPVHFYYRSFDITELTSLYALSDIAVISSIKDGMNLVCQEYIASRIDNNGILILSRYAGASQILTDAIIIDPKKVSNIEDAIKTALNMSEEEQFLRMKALKTKVRDINVKKFNNDFLFDLRNSVIKKNTYIEIELNNISLK